MLSIWRCRGASRTSRIRRRCRWRSLRLRGRVTPYLSVGAPAQSIGNSIPPLGRPLRVALFYHSIESDWNNGNAHFLRGVATELQARGHRVRVFEPAEGWSRAKLLDWER